MRPLQLCLSTLAIVGSLTLAAAAAAAPQSISAPDLPGSIALSARGVSSAGEYWEADHGLRIVRNVTAPALIPVLPEPSKATGAAVIVAPGGGFLMLSFDNEGLLVARWLADHGIAAFVLKYRTRPTPEDRREFQKAIGTLMAGASARGVTVQQALPEAVADGEAAVRLVRARAAEWRIDPSRVGFIGFSAGAVTSLRVGLTADKAARPDFIGSIYGPMGTLSVPADAPPAFFAVALDDALMARGKSLAVIDAWRDARRPVEAHLFTSGGHGFGMSSYTAGAKLWIDEFYAWLKDRHLLAASR